MQSRLVVVVVVLLCVGMQQPFGTGRNVGTIGKGVVGDVRALLSGRMMTVDADALLHTCRLILSLAPHLFCIPTPFSAYSS